MAVDRTGASQYVACDSQLPTLCFNTAPNAHFLVPDTHRQIKVSAPKAGILQGYRDGNSFRFLGIPYAQPPVGKLRFREPTPYVPTDESKVQDATKYGNVCPQQVGNDVQARLGTILTNQVSENEDCLYLNVYTPSLKAGSTQALLPVIVYIHGGGLAALSGSTPLFEVCHPAVSSFYTFFFLLSHETVFNWKELFFSPYNDSPAIWCRVVALSS